MPWQSTRNRQKRGWRRYAARSLKCARASLNFSATTPANPSPSLLWHIAGSTSLSRAARQALADATDPLIVPIIVLAEARYAIAKQRTTVTWEDLLSKLDSDDRFRIHDLDLDLVSRAQVGMEMHDALICATALAHQDAIAETVAGITRDRRIRDSGLVETVW